MLLVEHYVHISDGRVPLSIAQQATDELLLSQNGDGDGAPSMPAIPTGEPTAAQNDAALADLMTRIGGLGG